MSLNPELSESFRETLGRLAGAQKGAGRSAPAYSRFVNRRIGRVLAALAFRAGLSPNQVTAISAGFTFSGIVLLALLGPTPLAAVVVSAALAIGYAFDSADGQVARLRGGGSPSGEWLDHVVDCIKTSLLPLALLVGYYRADVVDDAWLLVPLAAAVVSAAHFFGMILTEQLRRQHGRVSNAADGPRGSFVRSILVLPTDYGVLCLSFALLGMPMVFLGVFIAITALTAAYTALALPKWFRELRSLPAAASPISASAYGSTSPGQEDA